MCYFSFFCSKTHTNMQEAMMTSFPLNQSTIPNNSSSNMEDTMTPQYYYAGAEGIMILSNWYKPIHGYLATVVCVFGIVANVLNIVVLTRPNMISSTNCILTGLAVSDGLTMLAYLPFALRFYCLYGTQPSPERNTLAAVRYMLFFACFSVVVHTVSIWLTLTLAIFRYIVVKYPRHNLTTCSLSRAKLAVILVYLVTIVVCIPNFVILIVKGHPVDENSPSTDIIWLVVFKQETEIDKHIHNLNFWIQAIVVKLVPCVGLTILSVLLVRTMHQAERNRRQLRGRADDPGGRDRKTNRTTRMLLTVVVLFLLTEFPQGIISLLSGILPHFVEEVYGPLGDIVDILALINNGINFILYCTMSKQFRDTFISVFFSPLSSRARQFTAVPLNPPNTTQVITLSNSNMKNSTSNLNDQ